jgi:hypothetical protein
MKFIGIAITFYTLPPFALAELDEVGIRPCPWCAGLSAFAPRGVAPTRVL